MEQQSWKMQNFALLNK